MQSSTLAIIDFSADYATCYLSLSDGRTAELATTELTPAGEEVDEEGEYIVHDHDGERTYGICERVEYDLDRDYLVDMALNALARENGITYEVTGYELSWQRTPITKTIHATSWNDLCHLTRHWVAVYGTQWCGAVGSGELVGLMRSVAA